MNSQLLFVGACYYSGLVQLVRWLIRCSGSRLIILNYHHATGGDLRSHLLYLRRHYRMLHLEDALEELYTPREIRQKKRKRDRRTPLVLTFDDGYYDNYTHAFALAHELRVPFTIFLTPGYIESSRCFWWMEADHLIDNTRLNVVTIEGHTYDLEKREGREALAQAIYMRLCSAPSVAEREAFLAIVREVLDVPAAIPLEEERTLTWKEIHEMEASGWVSFGTHTMHHPVLAYLKDAAEVHCEINECRTILEQELGHTIRSFAYPLGRVEHIGKEGVLAVQKAGYSWAVTTIDGINTPRTSPYLLKRIVSNPSKHWLVVAAETSFLWQYLSPPFLYGKKIGSLLFAICRPGFGRLIPICIQKRCSRAFGSCMQRRSRTSSSARQRTSFSLRSSGRK